MKSTLRNATMAAIIGNSSLFVLRLVATIFQESFRNITVARVTSILSLAAMATLLFFFVSFYSEFVDRKHGKLGQITRLVIICNIAMILLVIRRMFFVFGRYFPMSQTGSHYYAPIVQWLASLIILAFFILFYRETVTAKLHKLRTAAISAIVGSAIGTIIQTIMMLHNHSVRSAHGFFFIPSDKMIFFLPVAAIAFATIFYFFITFYKFAAERER